VSDMATLRALGADRGIAELATRQHGVVSIAQMHELGWSTSGVGDRLAAGKLHRLYRGVYAVGHMELSRRGRWLAAVFACGPGALVSHRSAAHLWGLRTWSQRETEVTSPARNRRRRGIRLYRATHLADDDRAVVDGIPWASVALTLLALAVVDEGSLAGAVAQAERRSLLDLRAVEGLLGRLRGRPGAPALHAAIAGLSMEAGWTRSELELRFLTLCREAGLPRPRVNAWVEVPGDGFEVDFSWPELRLIVETDGHETHGDRRAFEEDRRRDQLLVAAGWRLVRFTWRQVFEQPAEVAATMRRLVAGVNVV
jgi:very-short-patch-repair endonuclease